MESTVLHAEESIEGEGLMSSGGKALKRTEVQNVVDRFLHKAGIHDMKSQVIICGSYRREKPSCNDIDLVIVSQSDADKLRIEIALASIFGTLKTRVGAKKSGVFEEVKIQVAVTDFKSQGAALLMATGSAAFNIVCRAKAKREGKLLNQYGLFSQDEYQSCIASVSEMAILEALGMRQYIEPRLRELV